MQQDQLKKLIDDKNQQSEREANRTAASFIEEIVECQEEINKCNRRIEDLRKQLKSLEVEVLDHKTVLGE